MSTRSLPALGLLVALSTLPVIPAAASAELNPGERFPGLALESLDGPERSIADFRGRRIALHVFASW